jgi:large subunit ribosomal protein L22
MSTDVKTNERPGTRAVLRGARFSAYKAREVLDLVRGKSVGEARSILQFCDRGAAEPIMKLLDSAVANAGNNEDIPPEELYVGACFADEGPTLKRWRPRARGRATRINKRTCHITLIVSRYAPAEMDDLRARAEAKGRGTRDAGADRARRVARSRAGQAPAGEAAGAPVEEAAEATTDEQATDEHVTDAVAEGAADEAAEAPAGQVTEADTDEADTDEADTDEADTDEADTDEADTDEAGGGEDPADTAEEGN